MKRLTLAALAACLWASPALATLSGGYLPFTQTPNASTNLHMMWVEDDSLPGINGFNLGKREEVEELGALRARLENSGIEIHVYTYRQLQADKRLWRFAGLPRTTGAAGTGGGYACAFFSGLYTTWNTWGGLARAPYFRSDSTSTHIIQFGGITDHGVWDDGTQAQVSNANLLTGVGLASPTLQGHVSHYNAGANSWDTVTVVSSNPTDTLFYDTVNYNTAKGQTRPAGSSQMVRLFRSLGGAIAQTDSISPTAYDGDLLQGAYRMYYTNANYAGVTNSYTDFVLAFGTNVNNSETSCYITWALMSRWLLLPKIKVALVLQGLGTFGGDPFWGGRPVNFGGSSPVNASQWSWPRATYVDTLVRDLATTYHVNKITFTTQPDSLSWLMSNFPAWNTAVRGWSWARYSPTWASYDSLNPSRSPTGTVAISYGDTTQSNWGTKNSLRVGNRNDPTNATIAKKWGIAQSFAYQDSVLGSLGLPISKTYIPLQMGNNTISEVVMPVGPFDYSGTGAYCPAESAMSGFANAGRTIIVENDQVDPGDFSAPANTAGHSCRVVTAGLRWSILPDEVYTTSAGQKITFLSSLCIHGNYMGQTASPAASGLYTITAAGGGGQIPSGNINRNVALLFGMHYWRGGVTNGPLPYGSGVVQAGNSGNPSWGGNGRCRVFIFPLRFVGNKPCGWYQEYYLWQIALLKQVKCMEDIAGHQLIDWVYPEEAAAAVP